MILYIFYHHQRPRNSGSVVHTHTLSLSLYIYIYRYACAYIHIYIYIYLSVSRVCYTTMIPVWVSDVMQDCYHRQSEPQATQKVQPPRNSRVHVSHLEVQGSNIAVVSLGNLVFVSSMCSHKELLTQLLGLSEI